MITVTGMPDAAWYFARLDTASPSPPVRSYGDSSGTRCTTGAGVPSGRTRGAIGAPGMGVACTSVLRVRLERRVAGGRSASGSTTPPSELGVTPAPAEGSGSCGTMVPELGKVGPVSMKGVRRRGMTRHQMQKYRPERRGPVRRVMLDCGKKSTQIIGTVPNRRSFSYHRTRWFATPFARLRSESPAANITVGPGAPCRVTDERARPPDTTKRRPAAVTSWVHAPSHFLHLHDNQARFPQ